jgi:hypothetical protein
VRREHPGDSAVGEKIVRVFFYGLYMDFEVLAGLGSWLCRNMAILATRRT